MSDATTMMKLDDITLDDDIQSRFELTTAHVIELADLLDNGYELTPAVVFRLTDEPGVDLMAAGFHRWYAYDRRKRSHIPVTIRSGTRRDALLFSISSNSAHGLARSERDKHRAVDLLLADAEWKLMPNTWIARRAGVSEGMIRQAKKACNARAEDEKNRTAPAKNTPPASYNTSPPAQPSYNTSVASSPTVPTPQAATTPARRLNLDPTDNGQAPPAPTSRPVRPVDELPDDIEADEPKIRQQIANSVHKIDRRAALLGETFEEAVERVRADDEAGE